MVKNRHNQHQSYSDPYRQPPPPPPDYYSQYQPPGYPPYPPYPPYPSYEPEKKDNKMIIIIIIIVLALVILMPVLLAGILYVWVSDFGDGGTTGALISASLSDRNTYYQIEILKVSGGSLGISDLKFQLITNTGILQFSKSTSDSNPTLLILGQSRAYPIPSGINPVNENATNGDGETVDNDSINRPHVWENCLFCYLDANGDSKVNAGDSIWIYKDYDDDGVEEVISRYRFSIFDWDENEVLRKEF